MNKAQINFFETKKIKALATIKKYLAEAHKAEKITTEDKVAQIMSGEARFKIERFADETCPYGTTTLFEFFEFKGEEDLHARNMATEARFQSQVKIVERELDKIETNFVFEKDGFDATQALFDLIEKYAPSEGTPNVE